MLRCFQVRVVPSWQHTYSCVVSAWWLACVGGCEALGSMAICLGLSRSTVSSVIQEVVEHREGLCEVRRGRGKGEAE